MNKKPVLWTVAVLLSGLAGYFLVVRGGAPAYEYRFDKVSRGDLHVNVTTTGTLNAVVSVDVGTQVSGIISNLYADFNSVVKKGEVIARIDTTLLWESVVDAEAALAGAQAKAADSRRTLVREKALVDKQLDSQADYDSALTADETNQQSLLQAVSTIDQAKINLAYATIRAPVSGVVINRAVSMGETVASSYSSPLLYTIANDMSKMQVLTTVDESDIGMISIGQTATFSVEAYPDRKFSGVVSQIRLAPISIQNVVNYTVVIDVDNSDLKLMSGMTADVNVGVASAHDVLKVSNLALRFQPPADVVDSSRIQAMRQASPGRSGPSGDTFASGSMAIDGDNSSKSGVPGQRSLRQSALIGHIAPPPTGDSTYGITNLYPQFERPSYEPQHEAGRGRVWILNAQKKLEPVFVRTGVTDGRFTEVTSDVLKPGDQIVLGATSSADASAGSSPLAAGGQGPGGGFR